MNCKPGDLAYVTRAPRWCDHLNGRVVTVTESHIDGGDAVWDYEGPRLRTRSGLPIDFIEDEFLRPIRDPGDDAVDEIVEFVGAPVPAEVA